MLNRKLDYLLILTIAVAVIFALFYHPLPPIPYKASPIQVHPSILTSEEVDAILRKDFTVVRRVEQIPPTVRADYTIVTNETFFMANPRERMNIDFIEEWIPNTRLVFAGIGADKEVLVYEQGGIANTLNAMIVDHRTEALWARQTEHNLKEGVEHKFEIIDRAKPGKDLDVAEETHIRREGGPSNKGGKLANKRYQM